MSSSPSNSNVGILAAGIYPSLAALRSATPPTVQRFARVLGVPGLFRFVPLDGTADDGWTAVVPSAGGGCWLADRTNDQGPPVVFSANAATVGIYSGPWQQIPTGATAADSSITLDPVGALLGDTKELTRQDLSAHVITVLDGGPGGATLSTFAASVFGNQLFWFTGTNWVRRR